MSEFEWSDDGDTLVCSFKPSPDQRFQMQHLAMCNYIHIVDTHVVAQPQPPGSQGGTKL